MPSGEYRKFMPGEDLFKVYYGMGDAHSTIRLQKYALSKGVVNPKTLTVPNRMSLWKAMWRWAYQNPAKAKEIYTQTNDITDTQWKLTLAKNAKSAYQNKKCTLEYHKLMRELRDAH